MCFIALFAAVWCWIAWQLWRFHATDTEAFLNLPNDVVNVAGFLGTAVASGTAAVLGIQIQRIKKEDTGRPDAETHQVAAKPPAKGLTWLATLGILTYAAVGAFVVGIWLGRSAAAPDLIRAYGLGVVGWLAGAFTAYFHPAE